MKFKKWLALLLAILLLLCATACNYNGDDGDRDEEEYSDTNPSSNVNPDPDPTAPAIFSESAGGPLLYRVTDADGDIVWLFGSIHAGKDNFYPLPDHITDALEGSDGLAVEFDVIAAQKNILSLYAAQAKCQYSFGDSIQNHIPASLYERAVAQMVELGIYNPMYNSYMPVMWSSLIDNAKKVEGSSELAIDTHMIEMAYDLNLPVYDIESAELQYSMFASLSEDLQILLLESSLQRSKSEYQAEIDDLMNMWHSGNALALRAYLSDVPDEFTEEQVTLYQEYLTKTLSNRDIGMTEYVIEALDDSEELFVCVGAAHVVGKGGIIDQLLSKGYTVELIK